MDDEQGVDEEDSFRVSAEDAEKWANRLQRMAKVMNKKQDEHHRDGARMLYTAAALMRAMSMDLKQGQMLEDIQPLFGVLTVGEA